MVHSIPSRPRAALSLLLVGLVWAGCDSAGPAQPSAAAPTFDASALSGEELFRGLVLGDGPAAFAVPELWGTRDVRDAVAARAARVEVDPEASVSLAEARQAVVASLAASDPAFFERFKADVTSGSPLRVQRALRETTSRLLTETSSELRSDRDIIYIYAVDSNVVLDYDLSVNYNMDLHTSVFVFYLPPTLPSFATADLSAERVSALVADRLHVPGR